jgi:MoxR-like ATPase
VPHDRPYAEFSGDQSAHYVASPQTADHRQPGHPPGRPLLVEGEAGCGKTRLASAIAEELGIASRS